jgi:hypothetical protein
MPIEIPGPLFDRWVIALEPLAERDDHPKEESYRDGGGKMTARQVLLYLQHSSSSGTHTDDTGRTVASGDIVVLDPNNQDAVRARDVIQNAERLTDITVDERS